MIGETQAFRQAVSRPAGDSTVRTVGAGAPDTGPTGVFPFQLSLDRDPHLRPAKTRILATLGTCTATRRLAAVPRPRCLGSFGPGRLCDLGRRCSKSTGMKGRHENGTTCVAFSDGVLVRSAVLGEPWDAARSRTALRSGRATISEGEANPPGTTTQVEDPT